METQSWYNNTRKQRYAPAKDVSKTGPIMATALDTRWACCHYESGHVGVWEREQHSQLYFVKVHGAMGLALHLHSEAKLLLAADAEGQVAYIKPLVCFRPRLVSSFLLNRVI